MSRERFISEKVAEFPQGWSVKVRKLRPFQNVSLSRTALHEAKHLVLLHVNGTGAKSGTIIPGPGYLGMVEPNAFDAVAALGPDADGDPGSDHDRRVAQWGGADISSSRKIAKTLLNSLREEVNVIAGLLESEKTVTGGRVADVIDKYQSDPDEDVEVVDPNGNVTNLKTSRKKRHEAVFNLKKENEKLNKMEKKKKDEPIKLRPFRDKIKQSLKIAA